MRTLSSVAACVDMFKKKKKSNQAAEGKLEINYAEWRCNFPFLDVEYLINQYDGCEKPKDLQSNFGMETIRTLSDEETRARGGEINELLSLGSITHDFPAVIDNHPIGPSPSFSLVHRRFCASDQE